MTQITPFISGKFFFSEPATSKRHPDYFTKYRNRRQQIINLLTKHKIYDIMKNKNTFIQFLTSQQNRSKRRHSLTKNASRKPKSLKKGDYNYEKRKKDYSRR